jgi:hypothetical protein
LYLNVCIQIANKLGNVKKNQLRIWVMIGMEQSLESEWAGETGVLEENLLRCHFVSQIRHDLTRGRTQTAVVGSDRLPEL